MIMAATLNTHHAVIIMDKSVLFLFWSDRGDQINTILFVKVKSWGGKQGNLLFCGVKKIKEPNTDLIKLMIALELLVEQIVWRF